MYFMKLIREYKQKGTCWAIAMAMAMVIETWNLH
jgi:hypothetical protein